MLQASKTAPFTEMIMLDDNQLSAFGDQHLPAAYLINSLRRSKHVLHFLKHD